MPLTGRRHREVVDPTTMSLVSSHDRGNDLAVETTDQEQIRLNLKLPLNVAAGIVPGNDKPTISPKPNDGIFI
jgi:hypothetical protein